MTKLNQQKPIESVEKLNPAQIEKPSNFIAVAKQLQEEQEQEYEKSI